MKSVKVSKKLKGIGALALCGVMSFGAVACGGGGGNSSGGNVNADPTTTTVITILTGENAFGTDILQEQANRFAQKYAEKSYAPNKKGVAIKIETSGASVNIGEGLLNEGYHIISTGDGYTKVETAASNGWIASLDDIMKTEIAEDGKAIYEKIPQSIRFNYELKVDDEAAAVKSGYYGIPSAEFYGGLTYDKDLFDQGYYFANASASDATSFTSDILGAGYTYKFTAELNNRTVGPDGVANTEDDGLPSSLYELIALCEYLDNNSIKPFIMSGKMGFYLNYFTEALYMSLLGYENAVAQKGFKSDSMDIVVGYTNEDLFPGLEGVKKPITQTVKIEEEYGYYTSMSLEKYYTFAFMQLMEQESWYASASNSPNKGAVEAQKDFLFGLHDPARQAAMLIECSYWYNESRIRGNFIDYDKMYFKTDPDREVRWMSLPVNISTSVDGTDEVVTTSVNKESKKGEPITLYIPDGGYICVNARYKDDAEVMGAIKDYFMFRYSDAELSKTTVQGCYGAMLEYDIKDADLEGASTFAQSYVKLVKNANKVYPYGDSDVYRNNSAKLGKQGGSASYLFGGGSLGTTNVRAYLQQKKINPVLECFEEKMLDINDWSGYFGSNAQMPEAQKYPDGHPKAGQDIKYEGMNY